MACLCELNEAMPTDKIQYIAVDEKKKGLHQQQEIN